MAVVGQNVSLVDATYMSTCLLVYSHQIGNTMKVQLDEPMDFIGISYRNMGEEITQGELHHQNLPKHGRQLTKGRNLEYTAQPAESSTD